MFSLLVLELMCCVKTRQRNSFLRMIQSQSSILQNRLKTRVHMFTETPLDFSPSWIEPTARTKTTDLCRLQQIKQSHTSLWMCPISDCPLGFFSHTITPSLRHANQTFLLCVFTSPHGHVNTNLHPGSLFSYIFYRICLPPLGCLLYIEPLWLRDVSGCVSLHFPP